MHVCWCVCVFVYMYKVLNKLNQITYCYVNKQADKSVSIKFLLNCRNWRWIRTKEDTSFTWQWSSHVRCHRKFTGTLLMEWILLLPYHSNVSRYDHHQNYTHCWANTVKVWIRKFYNIYIFQLLKNMNSRSLWCVWCRPVYLRTCWLFSMVSYIWAVYTVLYMFITSQLS